MNNRQSEFVETHQLSIQQTYSTTENVLKTLANYLPRNTSSLDLEIYKTGYHHFKNLTEIKGLNYIEAHQLVSNALIRRLEVTPNEELFKRQIQKLENGLLLLEQCSPKTRHCLITNEVIPINNDTPQFIFINQCGLSSTGILRLMAAAKKHEDSEVGLYNALKEIADPSQQEKINNISTRDILRLRLHIEKIKFLPPTFRGIIYGFMLGGLTSLLLVSLVSLSPAALIIVAVLPSIIGMSIGWTTEKSIAKKEIQNKIGPLPVFSLAPSLKKLLTYDNLKPHFWYALFHCCRTNTRRSVVASTPSYSP